MPSQSTNEEFKPIPIRFESGRFGRLKFFLRMGADLQLLTCWRFLAPHLRAFRGDVLDVGCGEMPFRNFLNENTRYTPLDIPAADTFGMGDHADIVHFDGRRIPFPDESFENILCTEVLEHAADPVELIAEMKRVLRPGGTILVTVPFSARVHHSPNDYHRFTNHCLERMFSSFSDVVVQERGDDLAVIANKLIVVNMRLANPSKFWRLPLLAISVPAATVALAIAHISLLFRFGSKADPLGYGVIARKG